MQSPRCLSRLPGLLVQSVQHIPRWPGAQLSQHYLGVLFTRSALAGHWHPACLGYLIIAVTEHSVSGLQTAKAGARGGPRRPDPRRGRAQMGPRCQPGAAASDYRALGALLSGLCWAARLWLSEGRMISRLSLNKNSWIRHLPQVYFIKGLVIAGDIL